LLAQLCSAQGVVSGRFHMVTLCLLTETPFMALTSNSHKIEALLEAVGLHGRICSDYAEGLRQVQQRPFTQDELLLIRDFLQSARTQARQMFSEIATLAERHS
jgi:polysaccharide pyruvyl transferase WcaK-like protein